jgi:enterochelin esterase family protein
MTFPRNACVEYVFLRNWKRVIDPLNPRTTPNGVGGINNFFYAPNARPTPFLKTRSGVARGRVTTDLLRAPGMVIGNQRKVHLYQPPTHDPSALIVALDGQDYLRRVKLPTLLDNLYAEGKIPPLAVAMIESSRAGKGSGRMSEYACNELTLLLILRLVVPFAQERLNLLDLKRQPGAYGIMGASMGGLMSLFTALRAPGVFGTVISHAGAFELWDTEPPVFALAAHATIKPRVWLDVGQMDWLLKANRKMHKALTRLGFETSYREYYAYHNWPAWRDVLPDALIWAFGKERER